MDLGVILQATQSVEFDFLGETNTAEIYTAGISRLTPHQVKALQSASDDSLATMQKAVPLIVASWDLVWCGEPLAVASLTETNNAGEFLYPLPLTFMDALWKKAEGVFINPTRAEPLPDGLAQEPLAESVLTETAIQ